MVDIFITKDNSDLDTYKLELQEVTAIFALPIDKTINTHTDEDYSFKAVGIGNQGSQIEIKVTQSSFPYNWDNYHFKIALLARRFLKNESNLIY